MAEPATKEKDAGSEDRQLWQDWKAKIDHAKNDPEYKTWLVRAGKITKRYRDERPERGTQTKRFNLLWSNIQTLWPAIFSQTPQPIVERRFMQKDPAARLASTLIENCLRFQIEISGYYDTVSRCTLDYLLPGGGFAWVRYVPSFEQVEDKTQTYAAPGQPMSGPGETKEPKLAKDEQEGGDGYGEGTNSYEKLSYESLCVDYTYYKNFLWGPANDWKCVPWVDRISYMTREELRKAKFKNADKITLDSSSVPDDDKTRGSDRDPKGLAKKAEIHEIWCKESKEVIFIAPGTPDVILKREQDPLKLEKFWPAPPPLFSTQTNDTLIPVPDYVEYQDQAVQLDELSQRIYMLTKAIKAAGVYDSSNKGISRLLQDGNDLRLIPVDQWAVFAEKGGMKGAIELLPIAELATVLQGLYVAFENAKNMAYEITGMSDIVRGASEGGTKSATEQRIKGQYASMRLQTRQSKVASFCRDLICIMAEIICEIFSPETILQMSGHAQTIEDNAAKAAAEVPQPQLPEPPPGFDQLPAEQQAAMKAQAEQQMMLQFEQAQQSAATQSTQKDMAEFQKAIEIMRSDKLRGFRIDIETDSTIQPDVESDKANAVNLFSSTMQGLGAAAQFVEQAPELVEPIGDMIMFAYRRFRVGRTMEASLEEAIAKIKERLTKQASEPPKPTPEEAKIEAIKAKSEADTAKVQATIAATGQKAQIEVGKAQTEAQIEQQKAQTQLAVDQRELAIKDRELQLKEKELAFKEREMQMDAWAKQNGVILDMQDREAKSDFQRKQQEMKAANQ